jgi:exopolysaccharide production protein ExoQ
MNPLIASFVYACGIAGLFYLDRDKSVHTSKALWLPVIYIWIVGSRPVSMWFGIAPPAGMDAQLDGSPVDRAIFIVLLVIALSVLVRRGRRVFALLLANWPIVLYFLFCLVSVLWSGYPDVALKRWVKAIGDVVMVLIVVTDEQPAAALRKLFSRIGFVLIPFSLLLIKYYPMYGRGFDAWSGAPSNLGVTLNKNVLGVITLVLLLGTAWRLLGLLRSDENPSHRRRHLIAQGALFFLGLYLLSLSDSDTSTVAFVLGAGLLLATGLRFVRRNAAAIHVLVLSLVLIVGSATLLGGIGGIAHMLGRNSHLTGRTDIWAALIPLASNPLVGAGFESFWLSPRVLQRLWQIFPGLPLNEAHDGYLEVYLELGWVGVGLIGLLLADGYRRAVGAFRREPVLGGLLVAYVLSAAVYSTTEAGFRMLDPIWIFLLLAVVEATRIVAGTDRVPIAKISVDPVRLPAKGTVAAASPVGRVIEKTARSRAAVYPERMGVITSASAKDKR